MFFEFNENACRSNIEVFSTKLERIRNDIEFLERERASTEELTAHDAITEAIHRLRFEESYFELRIKEMQNHISSEQSV